ncbi:MAG: hypothetical protein P1P89_01275 [Desulfobacterales bacterium]|nr:hypothetical protein [Desulfobacterales bacterium]
MNTPQLYERIDQQVAEATRQYGLSAGKLKFNIHIFKPDSAKLETVIAVDIGRQNKRTRYKSSIRAFYSPSLYRYGSPAKLEKEVRTYLIRKIEPMP